MDSDCTGPVENGARTLLRVLALLSDSNSLKNTAGQTLAAAHASYAIQTHFFLLASLTFRTKNL